MELKKNYKNLAEKIAYLEAELATTKAELNNQLQKNIIANSVIDNIPVGIQVFDKNGISVMINNKQAELPGLSSTDEGVGQFNILTDPFSIKNGAAKLYASVYKKHKPISRCFEYNFDVEANKWNTRKDRFFLEETIFPVVAQNNQLLYGVAVLNDITEKKKFEQQLVNSEQRFRSIFTDVLTYRIIETEC